MVFSYNTNHLRSMTTQLDLVLFATVIMLEQPLHLC